jgi:hypothetical protein
MCQILRKVQGTSLSSVLGNAVGSPAEGGGRGRIRGRSTGNSPPVLAGECGPSKTEDVLQNKNAHHVNYVRVRQPMISITQSSMTGSLWTYQIKHVNHEIIRCDRTGRWCQQKRALRLCSPGIKARYLGKADPMIVTSPAAHGLAVISGLP